MAPVTLFVGTYTRVEGHVPDGKGRGVEALALDLATGALAPLRATPAGVNPSFLCGSRQALYVSSEDEPGSVASFAFGEGGALTETSRRETRGAFPCHVALSGAQDFLAATNYGGGSVALFAVNQDGTLSESLDLHAYPDSGSLVVPDRQEAAHVHSSAWLPGTDALLAADLGNDRVAQFALDRAAGKLEPRAFVARPPGSGPRHFAIHPSNKFAYVLGELSNTVGVHAVDEAGALSAEALQEIGTLPEGFTAWSLVADIHTSADGKFVFASNRGHDSIAVFKVDQATGKLEFVERTPTRGKTPRAFLVEGDLLIVANQDSHSISVFRIDGETGKLTFTGNELEVFSPVSLFIRH